MERFLFNLTDGSPVADDEGLELADVAAARKEAVRFLADALRHKGDEFWRDGRWTLTVSDARGLVMFSIFVDAVASAAVGPVYP